ncbi:MAG: RNA polymerase sigma factor, partial [Planctomycetes bacterium]|nr:RNA polymerase sigma factor [Planctomycetota bacterium]
LAIAANRCRTILAQRGRRQALVRLVHRLPDPEVPATSGDLAEEIQRALDRLPAKQRLAFVLFHEQDLGCAEVAAVLRCPEGTVKTWLHRARRQIADDLQRRGVVPEARYALR